MTVLTPVARRDLRCGTLLTALVAMAVPSVVVLVARDASTTYGDKDLVNAIGLLVGLVVGQSFALLLHPYRARGLVVLGAAAWVAVSVVAAATSTYIGWVSGLPLGLIWGGLNRFPRARTGYLDSLAIAAAFALGIGIVIAWSNGTVPLQWAEWFVAALAAALLLASIFTVFRPTFELLCEPVLWFMYSIRGTGPGLTAMPATGPCLVLANHACWFDPLFLAKVLPRPVTPMMTARFYNLPVIHWLMRRFGVIRVNEKAIRREMPEELGEAIAALDRGECVLIFPESYLRRTEERVLRRFARGIWQILDARPQTPVYCCWLDGTWGSYTSYWNGQPTKNKKKDVRRPVRIAVSDAVLVPDEVRKDHLKTRMMLMNEVASARKLLGLSELPRFELPADESEAADQT